MTSPSLTRIGPDIHAGAFRAHSHIARSRRILCATDLSTHARRAVARGILLANQLDAQLTVLHVVDGSLDCAAAIRDQVVQQLDSTGLPLRRAPAIQLRAGECADTIATVAKEMQADIVLLGSQRRSVSAPLIATAAERVTALAARPTLIVNIDARTRYGAVVIAAELSETFTRIMRLASALDFLESQTVSVVHGFESSARSPLYADGFDARARARNMEQWEKVARERLLMSFDAAGVDSSRFRIAFQHARPLRAIQRAVRSVQPELLIIGTSNRSVFDQAARSGTSYDALRTIECDILLAPPEHEAIGPVH
jgi:nucleotide-binding universal stress UspA family protein